MKTQSILIGVTLAVTLSGITSARAGSQFGDEQQSRSLSNSTVTVRGCVQSDPSNGVGASDRFVLRYATMGIGSTIGDSAEGADPRAGATPTSYVLDGSTSELRQHVGQQVEITGRLEARADTSPGRSDPSDRPGESGTSSSRTGPRLHVDSLRTVASTCSR